MKIKHLIKKIKIDGVSTDVQIKAQKATIKVVDNEKNIIEAYVSRFGNVDSYGDIVAKGAFADSLKKWWPRYPKGIYAHNWEKPIAKTLECYEDDNGLYVKAQLLVDIVPKAKEVWGLIKEGVLTDFSFGFSIDQRRYNEEGFRVLEKLTIWEWSPVLVGANNQATLLSAKSAVDKTVSVKEVEVEVPDETPTEEAEPEVEETTEEAPAEETVEEETTTEDEPEVTSEEPAPEPEKAGKKLSVKARVLLKASLEEVGFAREDIKATDERLIDLEKSIKQTLEEDEAVEEEEAPEEENVEPTDKPEGESGDEAETNNDEGKSLRVKGYLREAKGLARSSQRLIVKIKREEEA